MQPRDYCCWPRHLPHDLSVPATNLYVNLDVSAIRYPEKPAIVYYDTALSYGELKAQTDRIAGHLQRECGVQPGDRVMLCLQSSPQYVMAYYATLRANAVVVPANTMNRSEELRHVILDADIRTVICGQDLAPEFQSLRATTGLRNLIVATYSEYVSDLKSRNLPDFVACPRERFDGAISWSDALACEEAPGALTQGPEDGSVILYSSGTTGRPKGCVHTHRSMMSSAVTVANWMWIYPDTVLLSVLPLFHIGGMQNMMNAPIFSGATTVMISRWNRDLAGELIARHRISHWTAMPTMVVDFLANPELKYFDLSSIRRIGAGGAAMPEPIARRLRESCGLDFVEGYGLSETGHVIINPSERPKPQCLGVPLFNVDARIVDPTSLAEVPDGEVGEIIVHSPSVFEGYLNNPQATEAAFVELEGKRFFRTGDLGRIGEDGYFFMVDRLKRMVNASGYKVWPAEVEAILHDHPAVKEACVISSRDPYRGETVKAVISLKPSCRGRVTGEEIISWAKNQMAAYKYPRLVEFVDELPRTATEKIDWRSLQETETARNNGENAGYQDRGQAASFGKSNFQEKRS